MMSSRTASILTPFLAENFRRAHGGDPDDVLDLRFRADRIGGRQVDFIDDGQNFEIMIQRQIGIGKSLGFDALGGVPRQGGRPRRQPDCG
jgi:hypothetical protein